MAREARSGTGIGMLLHPVFARCSRRGLQETQDNDMGCRWAPLSGSLGRRSTRVRLSQKGRHAGGRPCLVPPFRQERESHMCDYSLQSVKSRPAVVGDKLVTHNFGTGTRGFRAADDPAHDSCPTAVCVLPGTELAFANKVKGRAFLQNPKPEPQGLVAIFRQINRELERMHHDALEFADGTQVLLNMLEEGQHATVLQSPAAPKTEAEAKEQERIPVVA